MIIECVKCQKKFSVNSELIPSTGRTIQCGSCDHVWFFDPKIQNQLKIDVPKIEPKTDISPNKKLSKSSSSRNYKETKKPINRKVDKKEFEIIEYKSKGVFTVSKFLSYIIVLLFTFAGVLIVIDTFKISIYQTFPKLELIIFSLYETLMDITLFVKDLI